MARATRFGFRMLLAVWLSACAQDPGTGPRPTFADGSSGASATSSDVQTGEDLNCQAIASATEVVSGVNFGVEVVFTDGTTPFEIVGFTSGILTSRATVQGRVTLTGTSDMRVTRRIAVRDAAGRTGSCSFQVIVRH